MKSLCVITLFMVPLYLQAQKRTISGSVKSRNSGEHLIGASIYSIGTTQGTTANNYGFYSLTLPRDTVHLRVSYVGYEPLTLKFLLTRDTTINLELNDGTQLKEVEITATAEDPIQESTRMGTIDVPIEQIKAMPALLGETDVLKVLQLLPGVQSGAEGSSGLYVRGGGPDQNLLLLDGVPVYNASHLFGFISVFNADAINHVELVKGGFPARYGGRLSSVIDISMKEGNTKTLKGEGSFGLVASRLTVEGPIKKDRTSFIVSARRTYIDLLSRPMVKALSKGDVTTGYFFYDLNTKINHRINDRNRIYLSTYLGDDKAYSRFKDSYDNQAQNGKEHVSYEDEFSLRWGNITTALRWNKIFTNKLFSNVTATYSRYRFAVSAKSENKTTDASGTTTEFFKDEYTSGIRDYALKWDMDYIPNPSHYIKFGVQGIEHLFTPGVYSYHDTEKKDTTFGARKIFAEEFYGYVEDDFLITDKLKVNAGLHASGFYVQNKFYHSLQPRFSARYLLTPDVSLKASYAQMTQYIHLLTNAGLGLPTDLWVPATPRVRPERSYISSAGLAYNLNKTYEVSLEGYYKKMKGLIEYKDGASYLNIESDWQTKVETGSGESYGAELFLQKKTGKVSGWVGYTLSWTNRTFANLNNGKTFPYKYDRRHDVEVALTYSWKENKDLALTWVYGTGTAVSLPKSSYAQNVSDVPAERTFYDAGGSIDYYESRNNYRMRAYHRLDLSYTTKKKTNWGERAWSIAIYNVYSRKNPFFMDIGYDKHGQKKFIQYSLFPLIPSVAYRFKF
ncbi:carboxypeptidase-like regulatory domain-containing protein [Fulvivirgaceae bacterium PWU4]|uniref:Carboxypeptidase-like regulatory domain-containing protein n=1 Tax=Chryseosolibacter histidini TaxID=2782349 RepID=A0AAP2DK70_9BACT|nr:TonB-dependent receptor [Chryseosolibacter histidini]MBT1697891.1 carboxypeptidase-like regulatory domain-containing protein [Chryseosolibacter histidini]